MSQLRFVSGAIVDLGSGEVARGDGRRRLEPQPAALLTLLAARAGTVVTHEEIVAHLWPPGTHVAFKDGVQYAVRQIRLACDPPAAATSVVETLPRRGYRLRAEALAPSPAEPRVTAGSRRPVWAWLAVAAAFVAGLVVVERRPNDHHARAVAVVSAIHDWIY